jgi:hypothetical protein
MLAKNSSQKSNQSAKFCGEVPLRESSKKNKAGLDFILTGPFNIRLRLVFR